MNSSSRGRGSRLAPKPTGLRTDRFTAARLEECAGALRSASGEEGNPDTQTGTAIRAGGTCTALRRSCFSGATLSRAQLPPSHSFLPDTASFQALLPSRHCSPVRCASLAGIPQGGVPMGRA